MTEHGGICRERAMDGRVLKNTQCLRTGEILLEGEVLKRLTKFGDVYRGDWFGTTVELPIEVVVCSDSADYHRG